MKVITDTPVVRRTAVELTDREIAMITRALYHDDTNGSENADLYSEFRELRDRLGIPQA